MDYIFNCSDGYIEIITHLYRHKKQWNTEEYNFLKEDKLIQEILSNKGIWITLATIITYHKIKEWMLND